MNEHPSSMTHELKTWPEYYRAVVDGRKNFEVRLNDRGFKEGDKLLLREFDPVTNEYTGNESTWRVGFVLEGPAFGIFNGVCVMSLLPDL